MNASRDNGAHPMRASTERALRDVRKALLHLHKVLLDIERAAYEREHGRVSAGELLKLAIEHRQFAWLHTISELVVRIDEWCDGEDPAEEGDVRSLLNQARTLLVPAEDDAAFARHYHQALQRDPGAVLAHRQAVMVIEAAIENAKSVDD